MKAKAQTSAKTKAEPVPTAANANTTKSAGVIALLRRSEGASLEEMMSETGWQKHSVRGFLAGALKKKHGLVAVSEKDPEGRRYRLQADGQGA